MAFAAVVNDLVREIKDDEEEVEKNVYLAVVASVRDGIRLGAVISCEHLGKFARDPRGQSVNLQQDVQQFPACFPATEHGFG